MIQGLRSAGNLFVPPSSADDGKRGRQQCIGVLRLANGPRSITHAETVAFYYATRAG
jgi:hypothetical protein